MKNLWLTVALLLLGACANAPTLETATQTAVPTGTLITVLPTDTLSPTKMPTVTAVSANTPTSTPAVRPTLSPPASATVPALSTPRIKITVTQPLLDPLGDTKITPQAISGPLNGLTKLLRSGDDCVAPCWQGLEPGISTRSDFDALVAAWPENRLEEKRCDSLGGTWYYCRWVDGDEGLLIDAIFEKEVISYFHFVPGAGDNLAAPFVIGELTLGDAFEVMGSPDSYSAGVWRGHGGGQLELSLYYEREGIIVNHGTSPYETDDSAFPPICEVEITPDMPVRELYFLEPNNINEDINKTLRIPLLYEAMQSWPGFGTVKLTGCW